jgi:hypothetical protein
VGAGHLDEADAELGGVHVSILAEWGRVRWGSRREPGLGAGVGFFARGGLCAVRRFCARMVGNAKSAEQSHFSEMGAQPNVFGYSY